MSEEENSTDHHVMVLMFCRALTTCGQRADGRRCCSRVQSRGTLSDMFTCLRRLTPKLTGTTHPSP